MADPYFQVYIHIVFAVKHRAAQIHSWEEARYKPITGIVQNKDQKLPAINGMPDPIHFFIGMRPSCGLSGFVGEVKKSSKRFIKLKQFTPYEFNWQSGSGAFSRSNQLDYAINNQKKPRRKTTFREEYPGFPEQFKIDYKNLFEVKKDP